MMKVSFKAQELASEYWEKYVVPFQKD